MVNTRNGSRHDSAFGGLQRDILRQMERNRFAYLQSHLSWLFDPLSTHIQTAVIRHDPSKQWMTDQAKRNTFVRRPLCSQQDIIDEQLVWYGYPSQNQPSSSTTTTQEMLVYEYLAFVYAKSTWHRPRDNPHAGPRASFEHLVQSSRSVADFLTHCLPTLEIVGI